MAKGKAVLDAVEQRQLVHPPCAVFGSFQFDATTHTGDDRLATFNGNRKSRLPVELDPLAGGEFVVVADDQNIRAW